MAQSAIEIVTDAFSRASITRSPVERGMQWTRIVAVIETPGFTSEPAAMQEVCRAILDTAGRHLDSSTWRQVGRALDAGLPQQGFLKTFASGLVMQCERLTTLDPALQSIYLRWSCLLLRHLDFGEAWTIKLFDRLALVQSKLFYQSLQLAALAAANPASSPSSSSSSKQSGGLLPLLKKRPELLDRYLGVIKAGQGGYTLTGLLFQIINHCAGTSELMSVHKDLFWDSFTKLVLSSATLPPPAAVAAFVPLAAQLTAQDLTAQTANLLRLLKRSPEAALAGCAMLFEQRRVGSGDVDCLEEMLPTVLGLCRNQNEGTRIQALAMLRALALKCSSAGSLGSALETVRGVVLKATEGKLTQIYQRMGMYFALAALCAFPGRGGSVSKLAATACELAGAMYSSEANEDAKCTLISSVLASWLPRCSDLPPDMLALLSSGIKEKQERVRRTFLHCLLTVFKHSGELMLQAVGVVPALGAHITAGLAKATLRPDALLSLTALVHLASADSNAEKALVEMKLWPQVLGPESSLLTASSLGRLTEQDLLPLAALPEMLLTQHFPSISTWAPTVARTLMLLTLHPASSVRRAAQAAAVSTMQATPNDAAPLLLNALTELVAIRESAEVCVGGDEDPTVSSDPFALVPPSRFALSLLALATPPLTKPDLYAQLLLLAHHPCVCGKGPAPKKLWARIRPRVCSEKEYDVPVLPAALGRAGETLVAILTGENGLASTRPALRTAALGALSSAFYDLPEAIYPYWIDQVRTLTDPTAHDALSAQDIKIWNTPPGQIAIDLTDMMLEGDMEFTRIGKSDDSGAAPAAAAPAAAAKTSRVSAAPSKPARGKAGAPASLGRPGSTGKLASAGEKKDPREERRLAQLASEAQVREQVQETVDTLTLGLKALSTVAHGNPPYTHSHLATLSEVPRSLLGSRLVGAEAAKNSVQALVSCVHSPLLAQRAGQITDALRIVAQGTPVSGDGGKVGAAVRLMEQACVETGPLPPPSYTLLFPLLAHTLGPDSHPSHALASAVLQIVSLHLDPSRASELPHRACVPLLLRTLQAQGPGATQSITPLLEKCCAALGCVSEMPEVLEGLLAEGAHVRGATLAAIHSVPCFESCAVPQDTTLGAHLFVARQDQDQANAMAAQEVWEVYGHGLGSDYAPVILGLLSHSSSQARGMATRALPEALQTHPTTTSATLATLMGLYFQGADQVSVAGGLGACASLAQARDLPAISTFLVKSLRSTPQEAPRAAVMAAGQAVLDAHGSAHVSLLLPVFEGCLEGQQEAAGGGGGEEDEEANDRVREGVAVFLGGLARHLPEGSPKVAMVVERLLEVLRTPSEAVQCAVANTFPGLIPSLPQEARGDLVGRLLDRAINGNTFADRRGGGFGLAGAVKGIGFTALKAHGVMEALKEAVENDKNPPAREGALLAFECLCVRLGRLFEPYVTKILPMLLVCFGDLHAPVRDATDLAAKAMMANLSGQGVKLVLPALLKGLEEKKWGTKVGSVQLLGAMAFCAPKQLSTCLPTIVPRLSEVINDTHPKVQRASQLALQQVGSVIRNPEVLTLVPALLDAITRPNDATRTCLDTLLETVFVNTVDAASLALIVPVLNRALRERTTDLKKKAAKIVGNMSSLINEAKDMVPYVPLLLPELKKVLLDPSPEVRGIASRALAALIQGMGEESFPGLVEWLLLSLRADTSSVERSGAAQGLAEVLAVLGLGRVEEMMPELLEGCSSPAVSTRDGHVTLLKYLPATLQQSFQSLLPSALPCILSALADETETVRDAALGAGRVVVDMYAMTAMPVLLPQIEHGIDNKNWRIRQSSVELLGNLLFRIVGTTGNVRLDGGSDDEGASTEAQGRALLEKLGLERRNHVLATVYMARSDIGVTVRNSSIHVWKSVVSNTPKTLREILPSLTQRAIASLSSGCLDQRSTAGRCLGELVKKLGDHMLPEIIPILTDGLHHDMPQNHRQGVCLGLSELVEACSRAQLADHMEALLPAVRDALCDPHHDVRAAAGTCFDTLFKQAGAEVTSDILPAILHSLETNPFALEGLREVLAKQPRILPAVLPRLASPPLTAFKARAIASLADVVKSNLQPHLGALLPPLFPTLASEDDEERESAIAAAEAVSQVVDSQGSHHLMRELTLACNSAEAPVRAGAAHLAGVFVSTSPGCDPDKDTGEVLVLVLGLLADSDTAVVKAAWTATGQITGTIPKESLPLFVKPLREGIASARERARRRLRGSVAEVTVEGFTLPKALQPVLPILLQGVLQGGSAETREASAEGLGELVEVTGVKSLTPFVIQITGPLIRIIGDKFTWQVKAAILHTLATLILKGGIALKPFLPQLQTTFVKCLHDSSRVVRQRAARAVGLLMALQPRVDPLVTDLLTQLNTGTPEVRPTMAEALTGTLTTAGKNISEPVMTKAVETLLEVQAGGGGEDDQDLREIASKALGVAAVHCSTECLSSVLSHVTSTQASLAQDRRHLDALALAAVLKLAPARVVQDQALLQMCVKFLSSRLSDDTAWVRRAALSGTAHLLTHQQREAEGRASSFGGLIQPLAKCLGDDSSEGRLKALSVVKWVAKRSKGEATQPHLAIILPGVLDALSDRSGNVKAKADRALRYCLKLDTGDVKYAAEWLKTPEGAKLKPRMSDALLKRTSQLADYSDASDVSDKEFE